MSDTPPETRSVSPFPAWPSTTPRPIASGGVPDSLTQADASNVVPTSLRSTAALRGVAAHFEFWRRRRRWGLYGKDEEERAKPSPAQCRGQPLHGSEYEHGVWGAKVYLEERFDGDELTDDDMLEVLTQDGAATRQQAKIYMEERFDEVRR